MSGVSVPDVGAPAESLPDVAGVFPPCVTPVVGLSPLAAAFWPLPTDMVFETAPLPPLVGVAELSVGVVVFAAAWAGSSATLIPKIVTPSKTDATPTFNFRRP